MGLLVKDGLLHFGTPLKFDVLPINDFVGVCSSRSRFGVLRAMKTLDGVSQ